MPSALLVNSTINKYLRDHTSAIMRKRKYLRALEENNRVKYGESGTKLVWRVRYKRSTKEDVGLLDGVAGFEAQNKHRTAELGWRSCLVQKAIHESDKLQNSGNEAIVKLWANAAQELIEDIRDQFAESVINVDGNTDTTDVHGLATLWGSVSAANANGFIGTPAGSYAGLSTVLGAYGGTWTGNWPLGYGDSHYDFWSPLYVDYTDTSWGSDATWAANAEQCMHYGIVQTERNGDTLDMILLERGMWLDWINTLDSKDRVTVKGSTQQKGFGTTDDTGIIFDGVNVHWESGIASGVGYGISLDNIELRSLQKQLFVAKTSMDHASYTDRLSVRFYGNQMFRSPRCFVTFRSLT